MLLVWIFPQVHLTGESCKNKTNQNQPTNQNLELAKLLWCQLLLNKGEAKILAKKVCFVELLLILGLASCQIYVCQSPQGPFMGYRKKLAFPACISPHCSVDKVSNKADKSGPESVYKWNTDWLAQIETPMLWMSKVRWDKSCHTSAAVPHVNFPPLLLLYVRLQYRSVYKCVGEAYTHTHVVSLDFHLQKQSLGVHRDIFSGSIVNLWSSHLLCWLLTFDCILMQLLKAENLSSK